jgi:hypothetical protein
MPVSVWKLTGSYPSLLSEPSGDFENSPPEKSVGVHQRVLSIEQPSLSKFRLVGRASPTFKVPYMQLVKILWCC